MRIKRHKIHDTALSQRIYNGACEALDECLASTRTNATRLIPLTEKLLRIIPCAGSNDAFESAQSVKAVRLLAQADAALFAAASGDGQPTTVCLGEARPITYESAPDESVLTAYRFIEGFLVAALCRDHQSLELLCRTPTKVVRSCSTTFPEYKCLFVDSLKSFWRNEADACERIAETMRAADSKILDSYPYRTLVDYAAAIDAPIIRLISDVCTKSSEFASDLEVAVKQHKEYWSKKSRSNDWIGFVALQLAGVCALAFDRGIQFLVDSDYLPMSWIKGDAFK